MQEIRDMEKDAARHAASKYKQGYDKGQTIALDVMNILNILKPADDEESEGFQDAVNDTIGF